MNPALDAIDIVVSDFHQMLDTDVPFRPLPGRRVERARAMPPTATPISAATPPEVAG